MPNAFTFLVLNNILYTFYKTLGINLDILDHGGQPTTTDDRE